MIIDKISLNNFRQYYGANILDLSIFDEKNIILIGGKNGYGKTNILLALVWCLYGEDISKIDENFRREIQKEGNYAKFLKGSLNWEALRKGVTTFSVEIVISKVELPETMEFYKNDTYCCTIFREFDVDSMNDKLEINIEGLSHSLFNSYEDKIKFINDYVVPIEAAKFVFFDAEKIASWAELSTKEEGNVLNDALGKILGLDSYDNLINDIRFYIDSLRKDCATEGVLKQITASETGIKFNLEKIEEIENEIMKKENTIADLKLKINQYNVFFVKQANKFYPVGTLDELYGERNQLKNRQKELEEKFYEISELIPFGASSVKLEELALHLSRQEIERMREERLVDVSDKTNDTIERIFNEPPFPIDGDMPFSKKMFYAEKAQGIIKEIFGKIDDNFNLPFEHDLSKSERDLIFETFNKVKGISSEGFEQIIDSLNRLKYDITEIDRVIKKTESDLEDEEVIEYSNKKADLEKKVEKLSEEKGALISQKQLKLRENITLQKDLQKDLKRISVSEQKKKKVDKANEYINALIQFVQHQKREKCELIEDLVLQEMQNLMHKLKADKNSNFIAAVKVEILPENDGLKIILFDNLGNIRQKESLSQGEKQIYISSLIKAILSLSIQEYPIFIDTPLGRLDDEHIKSILLYYYPDLACQVVLMATNNEIPPSRLKLLKENVARTYLLENINNNTKFKTGYFQSYEDQDQ